MLELCRRRHLAEQQDLLRFKGQGLGVWVFGFRVFGFRVSGLGFRVSGFGFRVSGVGRRMRDEG